MAFTIGDTAVEMLGFGGRAGGAFADASDRMSIDDGALRVDVIRNATFSTVIGRATGDFVGGVFTADGAPIPFAQERKAARIILGSEPSDEDAVDVTRHDEAIYGGFVFGRYGHVLLQSLARLWATDQRPDLPILFLARPDAGPHDAFRHVLRQLGIADERVLIHRGAGTVACLHVPEPGLVLNERVNLGHLASLRERLRGAMAQTPEPQPASVYLTRSGLGDNDRNAVGERTIETVFDQAGFGIRSLETLRVHAQWQLAGSATRLAGCIGSQFHNLLFRDPADPIDILYLCDQTPNQTYLLLDMLFPGRRIYARIGDTRPMVMLDSTTPFRMVPERLVAALGSFGLDADAAGIAAIVSEDAGGFVRRWCSNVLDRLTTQYRLHAALAGGPAARTHIAERIRPLVAGMRPADLSSWRPTIIDTFLGELPDEKTDTAYIRSVLVRAFLDPGR